MGDIADMMLDGTLCECCGVFIGTDAGIPGYCSETCANDRGMTLKDGMAFAVDVAEKGRPLECLICYKRFRLPAYMKQHRRDKHGIT